MDDFGTTEGMTIGTTMITYLESLEQFTTTTLTYWIEIDLQPGTTPDSLTELQKDSIGIHGLEGIKGYITTLGTHMTGYEYIGEGERDNYRLTFSGTILTRQDHSQIEYISIGDYIQI
jgi:hypothetical protein